MIDFPVTRRTHVSIGLWLDAFAQKLAPALQVAHKDSFRWQHAEQSPRTVQVAKAVRALSGLRAALHLADLRYTVEAATLLRVISDFSAEIIFIGEALLEARETVDQKLFIKQHFDSLPADPDELAARERQYYVGRKAVDAAMQRVMEKVGAPHAEFAKISAYLIKGYDGYVHGANATAMELYDARTNTFMLCGHDSPRFACATKAAIAGKTLEFLNSIRFMAITWGDSRIADEARLVADTLTVSKEDTKTPCAGLQ